jgi:nucleoside-diphosphate-sugar epimerase
MPPLILLGPGYSCMALARLASHDQPIFASARRPEAAAALRAAGLIPFEWEVGQPLPNDLALPPGAAVIYSVPTLHEDYEPAPPGELARHVAPVQAALDWARAQHATCFIYLSSSSVLGDHQGATVDEDAPCHPISPYGHMRLDIERHLMDQPPGDTDLYVARLVGIYGPGRTILDSIRAGHYRVVDPDKITNRIHVEDIAQALLAMIHRSAGSPQGHRLYNVCDGNPVTVGALLAMLQEEFGVVPPPTETIEQTRQRAGVNSAARWEASYRASNQRLLSELGLTLRYPNALDGYRAILRALPPFTS